MSDALPRDPAGTPLPVARTLDTNRRRFLLFGAGAAGAAAAAPVLASPAALVTAPVTEATHQGYRETEHVRNYYATTRI
jgi:hypothetical protein